jgi:hypothetical protein
MPDPTSFDFNQMIRSLEDHTKEVENYISEFQKQSTTGEVDLSKMFALQSQMQIMSQYIEAMSNVLSSVHNEMIAMLRAAKGQ